jgi:hypothetical protein
MFTAEEFDPVNFEGKRGCDQVQGVGDGEGDS